MGLQQCSLQNSIPSSPVSKRIISSSYKGSSLNQADLLRCTLTSSMHHIVLMIYMEPCRRNAWCCVSLPKPDVPASYHSVVGISRSESCQWCLASFKLWSECHSWNYWYRYWSGALDSRFFACPRLSLSEAIVCNTKIQLYLMLSDCVQVSGPRQRAFMTMKA